MKEKIDYQKLLVEIYYCKQNGISTKFQMTKSKKAEQFEREEKQKALEKSPQIMKLPEIKSKLNPMSKTLP